MPRAARRRSATTARRYVALRLRYLSNLAKTAAARAAAHRRRVRSTHARLTHLSIQSLRRTAAWWRALYNTIMRILRRTLPMKTRLSWPSREAAREALERYVLGPHELPYYLSLPKHMYCQSRKNLLLWDPGVDDIMQGRAYTADAVDLTIDDTLDPPPSNESLQDLGLLSTVYTKENEVYTVVQDAGEVNEKNDNITIARDGVRRNPLYTLPAFLYHYLEKLYTRIRAWITGREELEDAVEPCSLYIYPKGLKPRRSRNTRHRRVKVARTPNRGIYIRDYRKRWTPGVPGDEE